MPRDEMKTNESRDKSRAKVLISDGDGILIGREDILIAVGIGHVTPVIVIKTVGDEQRRNPFV